MNPPVTHDILMPWTLFYQSRDCSLFHLLFPVPYIENQRLTGIMPISRCPHFTLLSSDSIVYYPLIIMPIVLIDIIQEESNFRRNLFYKNSPRLVVRKSRVQNQFAVRNAFHSPEHQIRSRYRVLRSANDQYRYLNTPQKFFRVLLILQVHQRSFVIQCLFFRRLMIFLLFLRIFTVLTRTFHYRRIPKTFRRNFHWFDLLPAQNPCPIRNKSLIQIVRARNNSYKNIETFLKVQAQMPSGSCSVRISGVHKLTNSHLVRESNDIFCPDIPPSGAIINSGMI